MSEYTYRAEWAPDACRYLGLCLEFPDVSSYALTAGDAIAAVERKVAAEVAALEAADLPVPESLTDRRYSGKFVVRVSPELHARLVVEAAEQNVSLNQWVMRKMVERATTLDDLF